MQELKPKSLFLGAPGNKLPWLTFPSFQLNIPARSKHMDCIYFRKPLFLIDDPNTSLISPCNNKKASSTQWSKSVEIVLQNILWWNICDMFLPDNWRWNTFEIFFCKIFCGEIFDAGKMTWAMVLPFWCSRGKKKLAVINNSHFLSSHCAKSQF